MSYEAIYKRFQPSVPLVENMSMPVINVIGSIAQPVAPALQNTPCEELADRFDLEPDSFAIAVVNGATNQPIGLVTRQAFTTLFASRFGRSLYRRKPISDIMQQMPLIVDVMASVDDVEQIIAMHHPEALSSGFIVTENDQYKGICSALLLLRLSIQRTRSQNQQLDDARRLAEQANSSKSLFLANMSHELRTPLNAIIGFSEIMDGEMFGSIGNANYLEYAGDIMKSGKHLLSIVNDVLDMSKIEQGMFDLNIEPVDVKNLVMETIHFFRNAAEKAKINLETKFTVNQAKIDADARAIKQILINLVSNAIKFTSPGGNVRIQVDTNRSGGILLSVKDNGSGIASKDIEHIMEPFTQAENSMNKTHQGTGLGLTLVKALAGLHKANVKLDSTEGFGTIVTVNFPSNPKNWTANFPEHPH